MSGQHVSDMAMSFVEMAKAFEELPKVKAELAEANRAFNHASDTIQRLELKLIDRNTTIDELHAKVREAEVARDDAELRFLEADEKLGNVAKALQAAGESVGLALRKPEPVKMEDRELMDPTIVHTPTSESSREEGTSAITVASISTETGQSVAEPSAPLPDATSQPVLAEATTESQSASEVPPEPFSPESSPTDPVEVREEPRPTLSDGPMEASSSGQPTDGTIVESTNTGQSDPLPTVASPIDGSLAGNTNANPSGDASSPIDEPSYANEPKDRWTQDWSKWAERMDAKYGTYRWPDRTAIV